MNRRQYKKLLYRKLYSFTDHERIKAYTYRGVDENGYLVVLGFTCKPKQEGCHPYGIKYIAEMLHFHENRAYKMFSPINTHYANKYFNTNSNF
jgi:hypothetical protein